MAVAGPASATTRRDGYASPPRCVPVASDEAVSLGVALTVAVTDARRGSATPTHQLARTTGVAVRPASARSISSSFRSNRGCRLAWPAFWPGEEVWFCAVGCSAVAKSPEGCVVNWDWRGRAAWFWGVFGTAVVRFGTRYRKRESSDLFGTAYVRIDFNLIRIF